MSVEKMTFDNSDAAIMALIDRAHPAMLFRELQANAIDADCELIEWKQHLVEHQGELYRKLAIKSVGTGMDDSELENLMKTFFRSGGGKHVAVNKNFGMGAKATLLKACKLGGRYISCKNGIVSTCWLRRDQNGIPGLHQTKIDDRYYAVTDITDAYSDDEKTTDWVEVVIMGDSIKHDTFLYPLIDREQVSGDVSYWLCHKLNQRFYEMPRTKIDTSGKSETKKDSRSIIGMGEQKYEQKTIVPTGYGCIRYLLIDQSQQNIQAKGLKNHTALVWQNEMYDVKVANRATTHMKSYKVPFGGNSVAIQVHLNDSFCETEANRVQIYNSSSKAMKQDAPAMALIDFADDIIDNRPQWLIDHITNSRPAKTTMSEELDQLKRQLAAFYNQTLKQDELDSTGNNTSVECSATVDSGNETGGVGNGSTSTGDATRRKRSNDPKAPRSKASPKTMAMDLDAMWLDDEKDIAEYQLTGRLFVYDSNSKVLMGNRLHSSYQNVLARLISESDVSFENELRQVIETKTMANAYEIIFNVLQYENTKHWSSEDTSRALSGEALTASCGCEFSLYQACQESVLKGAVV